MAMCSKLAVIFTMVKCVSVTCSSFKQASTVYLNISRPAVSPYSLVISLLLSLNSVPLQIIVTYLLQVTQNVLK
jgi:hypothetical protein